MHRLAAHRGHGRHRHTIEDVAFSLDDGIAHLESRLRLGPFSRDGFHLIELRRHGTELYVVFRWRENPHRFGVRIPIDDTGQGIWTGLETTSAQDWAGEVQGHLAEELMTGYVARAGRRPVADYIELSGTWWVSESARAVGEVPAGGEGQWLARDGLHPGRARRFERRIAWLQAHVDNADAEQFVGQAFVTWASPGTAMLALVELTPGTPLTVGSDLTWTTINSAADAGASHVVTSFEEPWLDTLGFRPAGRGMLATSTTFLTAQGW